MNSNGTRYAIADNLGSPRVVTNSGGGGVVSRHDYMPFGEELFAGTGGRTVGMGFSVSDGNRQKFTGYERDNETGLDFAQARYHSSNLGRFTSPDPFGGSMRAGDPQSFNRYAYVGNNPVNATDPTGLVTEGGGGFLPGANGALGRVRPGESLGTNSFKTTTESESEATSEPVTLTDDELLAGLEQILAAVPNPNDLQNAVVGSPGTGRPFDAAPGPDGRVFHDGAHALSRANAANAVTLPALAGEVIYKNVQEYGIDSRGRPVPLLYTVDVRPTNGNFIVVYKDLASVTVRNGQMLAAGDVIGTVRPAGDPKSYIGLHVTLVRPKFYAAFRRETKTQAQQNRLGTVNTRKMFIDPLGPESPIRRRR